MSKLKLATLWFDGCSGCHMSFLDMDERLIELNDLVDVVYSPLVDQHTFPDDVDITLIEGAIGSEEDRENLEMIRSKTKTLVAFGDCAVTANVPGMRNAYKVEEVLDQVYMQQADINHLIPDQVIPKLEKKVVPLHQVVSIDYYIPGCPPNADVIYKAVVGLIQGKEVNISDDTHFGA